MERMVYTQFFTTAFMYDFVQKLMIIKNTTFALLGTLSVIMFLAPVTSVYAQTNNDLPDTPMGAVTFGVPIALTCFVLDTDCVGGPGTPYTFDCGPTGSCWITITDCCVAGDIYDVFDFGGIIGTAAALPDVGVMFCVGPGTHSITVQDTTAAAGIPAGLEMLVDDHILDCTTGGEYSTLNTSALLLASLQMSAMWLIPAISASAGIVEKNARIPLDLNA